MRPSSQEEKRAELISIETEMGIGGAQMSLMNERGKKEKKRTKIQGEEIISITMILVSNDLPFKFLCHLFRFGKNSI